MPAQPVLQILAKTIPKKFPTAARPTPTWSVTLS